MGRFQSKDVMQDSAMQSSARPGRWLALAAAVLAVCQPGCQLQQPYPFDPRQLQEVQREAGRGNEKSELRPLPTTMRFNPDGTPVDPNFDPNAVPQPNTRRDPPDQTPVVRLTLQEVVRRAVMNNKDIQAAGFGPGIEGARVVEAEARFDPSFFSNAGVDKTDQISPGQTFRQFAPSDPFEDDAEVFTIQSGLRQVLETGAQVEARYQLQQTDQDPVRSNPNPYNEAELVLQLTQPLLRDFGTRVNRARIVIARNNQRISLLEFRRTAEDQLTELETRYWQLVSAEREVRIQEELLDMTIKTAEILFKRLGQDVTRVQVSQANASVENRRAVLVRARANVKTLSDQVKQLMNDNDFPVASRTLVLPASTPIEEPVVFDPSELIDVAMEHRTELAQQQLRVNNATETFEAARNNTLPQLNFVGSVTSQGLDDDFRSGMSQQSDFRNIGYTAGLQFEVPLGNREARAIYRRTLLTRSQEIARYQSLIDQVALDVKNQHREVETTWNEVLATRDARFANFDSLRAIEQREQANEPLTPTFVQLKLDTQERLAQAALAEVNAISSYNTAIARLERAKGTLLRYYNIVLEEQGLKQQFPTGTPKKKK
jgi:outer membrane protein TolC